MKNRVKRILQSLLGYQNYLFLFALWSIFKSRFQRKDKDFAFFVKLISDHGLILDVGACIGDKSYILASRKPNSIIYAFEPVPDHIAALRKVIKWFRMKNIRVMETALGDQNGEIEMVLSQKDRTKMHRFCHVEHSSISDFNEGERITVPIKQLDSMDVFSLSKYFISGIKLSASNFEYHVLRGGHLLLQRHRPIVYAELWDNENRTKCFELMNGYGYEINVLIAGKLVSFNKKIHHRRNFFFVPED